MDPETAAVWRALLQSWDTWLLTLTLVGAVPVLGYVRFRRFLASSETTIGTGVKLTLYGRIVASQWLLVVAMALVLKRHGLRLGDAGQHLGDQRLTYSVAAALLLLLAVVAVVVLRRVRRAPAKTATGLGRVRNIIPSSGVEIAAFMAVCLTAGICEELLYRGWLLNVLQAATGSVWAAVAIDALVFGACHLYQGRWAAVRTGFVGLQLALLFVATGSLIPGQALHAGVDVLVGLAGALAVRRRGAEEPPSNKVALGERNQ